MKTLFSICLTLLIITSCHLTDRSADKAVLAGKVERNLTITTGREYSTGFGEDYGEGTGFIQRTDAFLSLRVWTFSSGINTPRIMRSLVGSIEGKLFQNTINIGDTWEQYGHRGGTEQVTLEGYEDVNVSNKVYPKCLKHKTVITDTIREHYSELEEALVNGTRYLWFSQGIGVVKMRYEHSNGVVTEAELIDFHVATKSNSFLPISLGTSWTYKWKNDFENLTLTEKILVIENKHDKKRLALNSVVNSEVGKKMFDGNFYLPASSPYLKIAGAGSSYTGRETPRGPKSIFSDNIENLWPDLFRYPLNVGKTWSEEGLYNSQVKTTIEDYETVEIALGTYKDCLKLKSVFMGATADATASMDTLERISLINGTRSLWFAKGVGLVKMRYEHSNDVITKAELKEYNVPGRSKDFFPLNIGTMWTYKWQNEYQPRPMIEKIVLSDPKILPETPLKQATYVLTIDNPKEPGEMRIDYNIIPENPSLETLQLRLNGDSNYIPKHSQYIPDESEDKSENFPFTRGLTVEPRPIGFPHFTDYPYPVWKVNFFKHGNKSPIGLNYEISQKFAKSYKDFMGKRDGHTSFPKTHPYYREDCMLWSSGDLFIVGGKTDKIEVEFKLPEEWEVLTPWKRIGSTGHRYAVQNQKELTTNYLLFGEHTKVIAKSGKTEVVIGIGGSLKTSKGEMQNTVEKFLNAYSKVFNDEPDGRMVFIVNPYEGKGEKRMKGVGRTQSVSILMDETLQAETKHEWGPFLGHEVFHIWNGLTALTPFTSKERWFAEGVTNYYSDITSKQLGYLSESEYFERLKDACEGYLAVSHDFAIGDDFRDSRLLYEGGSLVAASLDLQIRHITKNRKNFNHVMQQMYQKFPDNTIEYTQRDIIRTVNKVSGKDFDAFFKTYVTGKERLPLIEYFNYAGLDVQIDYSEELPTSDYVYDVLRASIPKQNWHLLSVNGIEFKSFDDLREDAKSWKSGDPMQVTIKENDKTLTIPITLSGIVDNPPTLRDASVSITKKTETNKLQRRILASILGNE